MIELFLATACVLYVLEYAIFFAGLQRSLRQPTGASSARVADINIVVAARNEAANIERCLRAVLAQDYPHEHTRIIAIDDDSDDATLSIMREIAASAPDRVTIVSTRHEDTHARGKARAIAQGMDHATGEIVLLTDADCTPPRGWARSIVDRFHPEVDALGGFTLVHATDLFSAVQQLDWLHLHSLASGGLAWNIPLGIIGNNFAFRRSAYEAVGGYRTVRFTVTEDFALFRAIHRRGGRVLFPCAAETRMITQPCATLGEVMRQKQRWARGGMETGVRGYAVLVIALMMMIALTIAPFVGPAWWAAVWGTKFGCDLLVMLPVLKEFGRVRQLRYFLLFEFYFIAQALVVPFLLMNRTVVWKGRAFRS